MVMLSEGLTPSYKILVDRQNSSGTVRSKRQAVQLCVCVEGGGGRGRGCLWKWIEDWCCVGV